MERQRIEEEARLEAERLRAEEEEEKRVMEETERLAAEARRAEEERIKKAIEVMIEGVSKSLPNEKSMIDILHYL